MLSTNPPWELPFCQKGYSLLRDVFRVVLHGNFGFLQFAVHHRHVHGRPHSNHLWNLSFGVKSFACEVGGVGGNQPIEEGNIYYLYTDVSENRGTPKSSIFNREEASKRLANALYSRCTFAIGLESVVFYSQSFRNIIFRA